MILEELLRDAVNQNKTYERWIVEYLKGSGGKPMSDLARVGVEQAVGALSQTAELAVKALDVGTGTAVDAVQTLVGMASDTSENISDLADATLKEIEDERADLIDRINAFQKRTTERLGTIMGAAADAIPVVP